MRLFKTDPVKDLLKATTALLACALVKADGGMDQAAPYFVGAIMLAAGLGCSLCCIFSRREPVQEQNGPYHVV